MIESQQVEKAIDSNQIYDNKEKTLIISKNTDNSKNEESRLYIMTFKHNNIYYDGIASKHFTRNDFGVNRYENGDVYIGTWLEDEKHGFGLQITPRENNSIDLYIGNWIKGNRNNGLYLWGEIFNNSINMKAFDYFFGKFEKDQYKDGVYYTLKDENYYYYMGKFEKHVDNSIKGETKIAKVDPKGLFYIKSEEKAFEGRFSNDVIVEGNVYSIKDSKSIHCTFSDGKIKETSEPEMTQQENKDAFNKVYEKINNFNSIDIQSILSSLSPLYLKYKNIPNSQFTMNELENIQSKMKNLISFFKE